MKNYIEYTFEVNNENSEILMAFLAELPFEVFEEKENSLLAYIKEDEICDNMETRIHIIKEFVSFSFCKKTIPSQNWNKKWESNFHPICVPSTLETSNPFCYIHANFHPAQDAQYDLLIAPEMAFGTGHHATTYQMIQVMQKLDFNGKKVLDFGCGTGILAVLAKKMGAKIIHAVDNDENAYANSLKNCKLNDTSQVVVRCGTLNTFEDNDYDIILANINLTVIESSLIALYQKLLPKGTLIVSGVLTEHKSSLLKKAEKEGWEAQYLQQKGQWLCIEFQKTHTK